MKEKSVPSMISLGETIGFTTVILLVWFDEIADIPHLLLGAPATPVNWRESLFETVVILLLMAATMRRTRGLVKKIRRLEGILPVCSFCKRVRDGSRWHNLESFIESRSEAEISHGLCPECARRHYPDYCESAFTSKQGDEAPGDMGSTGNPDPNGEVL